MLEKVSSLSDIERSIASILILFQGFCQNRQALGRKMMSNTQSVLKRKLLLESERVEVLRININSQDDHDTLFLTGFVREAMEKKVVHQ